MTRRPVPMARLGGLLPAEWGLTAAEVEERRLRYGVNNILEGRPHASWELARDTAKDPMIWFLAGVSGLYGVVGEMKEALTLLVAIVPLIGMDAFLHRRTQASTEGLNSRLAERATIVRDGPGDAYRRQRGLDGDAEPPSHVGGPPHLGRDRCVLNRHYPDSSVGTRAPPPAALPARLGPGVRREPFCRVSATLLFDGNRGTARV